MYLDGVGAGCSRAEQHEKGGIRLELHLVGIYLSLFADDGLVRLTSLDYFNVKRTGLVKLKGREEKENAEGA